MAHHDWRSYADLVTARKAVLLQVMAWHERLSHGGLDGLRGDLDPKEVIADLDDFQIPPPLIALMWRECTNAYVAAALGDEGLVRQAISRIWDAWQRETAAEV